MKSPVASRGAVIYPATASSRSWVNRLGRNCRGPDGAEHGVDDAERREDAEGHQNTDRAGDAGEHAQRGVDGDERERRPGVEPAGRQPGALLADHEVARGLEDAEEALRE